ncbi:uncharacterized protein DSM5745_02205 [Aspergillus mulundensis]|uniref:Uncharacterized protein n=1 Tax=Aspergillus mulundensis TaxID=1810919 RepID=A0A3D8SVV4_9EURO|nr:Uncharacterized protein DSM5745_02205 [Aspergillus mulundensis]RDW90430.1 Uncharacterized protein DSM5745_02205 [Aspergillus mulundensis]
MFNQKSSKSPTSSQSSSRSQSGNRQQETHYRVFIPQIDSVAFDPLDPPKRYHEGIFVTTNDRERTGTLFHVTGDVIAAGGMRYEAKDGYDPLSSRHFHAMPFVGWVRKDDYHSGRIDSVLRALPRPTKQQGLNFWQKKEDPTEETEMIWTKQNGDPYKPGEPRRPIFKCNEWTHQYAVPALRNAGILRSG